jgi:biopolymer transport protein ExbD
MAFLFSKRKLRATEEEEAGELNIVPYLDILMNLIMFMLLSITGLATFGVLNVSAPNYGASAQANPDEADKPKLLLSVLISKKGFYVAGAGAVLGQEGAAGGKPQAGTDGAPTVPRRGDGSYDYSALTAQMVQIKKAFPNETKVIVGAESDIIYETLVDTMDAIRELPGKDHQLLFSDVTLAAM